MMNENALKTRVQNAAQALGLPYNDVFHRLVMERFLVRLALSEHRSNFIFKGGFLLSRYVDLGRDTRDLDFLIHRLHAEKETLTKVFNELAILSVDDGFIFEFKGIKDLNHEHMKYSGFTASLLVTYGKIRESVEIDIGCGDAVEPQTKSLKLMQSRERPIFEEEISLMAYPPESILAEKLQTAVVRAEQNSRMKDYHDIFVLLKSGLLSSDILKATILSAFAHRETSIDDLPLKFSKSDLSNLQKYWTPFFRGIRKKNELSPEIKDVITAINNELQKLGFGG
jgi:predicted nucleotidyltransferase component of viral defense system